MGRLIVVSNRVALPDAQMQAGGLAIALADALTREGGLWCGWSGEISDSRDITLRDSGNVCYCTADFTPQEHEDFYLGFCNSLLWPLFHYRVGLMHFSHPMYAAYQAMNDRFATMVAQQVEQGDRIWVHDYHFLMMGACLRRRGVDGRIGFFLHIPFPAPEVLCALPCHKELLSALCAYDVIGFQTEPDFKAFLRSVMEFQGGRLLRGDDVSVEIEVEGRHITVGHFPIGIDTPRLEEAARRTADDPQARELRESLHGRRMIIGVDRLDYSKGLLHRLEAYRHFFERHPEQAANSSYIQITPPSRADVVEYRELREQLEALAAHINGLYATVNHTPIRYLCQNFSHEELAGLFRLAQVGLVTSLRDGMNLVAKEYIACQDAEDPGVLVLSEFAGAAQELEAALLINPHDAEATADAIHRALTMSREERRERHSTMMDILRRHTIHDWTQSFLAQLERPAQLVYPRRAVG